MLKWSPEPFASEVPSGPKPGAEVETFEPANGAVVGAGTASHQAREFRREAGFSDGKTLLNSLTAKERAQVYELVELDVAEEYTARENILTSEFEDRLAAAQAESRQMVATWTAQLTAALAEELKEAAAAAARLAVQMAEKIVRQSVAADPEALARVVETTLFKVISDSPLTVRTHPADAEWLVSQSELAERLHIGQIIADRRVDQGGCVICSDGREWDATLARQLDTLGEIVAETIATQEADPNVLPAPLAEEKPLAPEAEADDVPGVE